MRIVRNLKASLQGLKRGDLYGQKNVTLLNTQADTICKLSAHCWRSINREARWIVECCGGQVLNEVHFSRNLSRNLSVENSSTDSVGRSWGVSVRGLLKSFRFQQLLVKVLGKILKSFGKVFKVSKKILLLSFRLLQSTCRFLTQKFRGLGLTIGQGTKFRVLENLWPDHFAG